ncbi:TadE/TadG family type IV pilus assembly protein [Brevundimonas sp. VNH65]|uniref:TadE/TadG family type IV pilus assembly protein n=1 Tax=Brevundimonas sp. VNH65 TaxID=3400917 RepID=UPI003C0642CB
MTTELSKSSSQSDVRRGGRTGAAAVEFALVAPLLIVLLLGVVVYGGWFWLSHSVQSLASESARAALGGLDADEQRSLAEGFVQRHGGPELGLDPALTTVAFASDPDALTVSVTYEASGHPLMLLAGPLPRPPSRIRRTAVVRTGGY